jgi:hypothetical protein
MSNTTQHSDNTHKDADKSKRPAESDQQNQGSQRSQPGQQNQGHRDSGGGQQTGGSHGTSQGKDADMHRKEGSNK